MSAHAYKLKAKESPSVADAATRQQGTGAASSRLVDNRPEAAAQRKLQEAINNSPQSRKAAQLRAMAETRRQPPALASLQSAMQKEIHAGKPNSPLQRKPLNSALLNVAGEDHDKSDEFRTWESEYTKEKTGGTYWQEDEFQIDVPKPGGQANEKVAVHGDPKILQLVNMVHFNTKPLSNVVKFLTRIEAMKVSQVNIKSNRQTMFGNLQLVQKQLPLLTAFVALYKKLKQEALAETPNRPDLKKFSDVYIGIADELYGTFVAKVEEWVTHTATLNKDTANKVELQTAVTALAGFLPNGNNVLVSIFDKTDVPAEEHDQGKDLAILERSTAMHQAGTAGKASKGVWKVGNQHVKDIQNSVSKDVQPAYELMTEDEFNQDFDKWLAQNQDYQDMKNMENQV